MSRFRLIILSLFAVFAVSAVSAIASASASAEDCLAKAGSFVICLGEPLLLATGTFFLHVENATVHSYVLKGGKVTITCTTVKNENAAKEKVGELEGKVEAEKGKVRVKNLVLEFSNCSATNNCEVKTPIFTEKLEGEVDGKELILFFPATGSLFAVITLKGEKCSAPGKDNVTGEKKEAKKGPLCVAGDIEKTKEEHVIECVAEKSHLEFLNEPATFEGKFNVRLLLEDKKTFDKLWDIREAI